MATKFKLKVISTREILSENPEVLIQTGWYKKFRKSVYSLVLINKINTVDVILCQHYIISHFVCIRTSCIEVPLFGRKPTKPHQM